MFVALSGMVSGIVALLWGLWCGSCMALARVFRCMRYCWRWRAAAGRCRRFAQDRTMCRGGACGTSGLWMLGGFSQLLASWASFLVHGGDAGILYTDTLLPADRVVVSREALRWSVCFSGSLDYVPVVLMVDNLSTEE